MNNADRFTLRRLLADRDRLILSQERAARRNPSFAFPPPREEPSWMQRPTEDSGLIRIAVVGLAVCFAVGIALAFFSRVGADIKHDEWARQTMQECVSEGKYPHVDRDKDQRVLSVRCDAFEEDGK